MQIPPALLNPRYVLPFITTPFAIADAYKPSHWIQYPEKVVRVYDNGTSRRSRISGIENFCFVGLQVFLIDLVNQFKFNFFDLEEDVAVANFDKFYTRFFGVPSPVHNDKVRALHQLGYLPLTIKALEEGSVVPMNMPYYTIQNTEDDFKWLTGQIETWLSVTTWKMGTSATMALQYRRIIEKYNKLTSDLDWLVDYQGHNFSMRGMSDIIAAGQTDFAHRLFFMGTDTCPTDGWLDAYYCLDGVQSGTSIPATEHSVQCAHLPFTEGEDTEASDSAYLQDILNKYPSGFVSIVVDGYDFWRFITVIVPKFKDQIMAREGKIV